MLKKVDKLDDFNRKSKLLAAAISVKNLEKIT